MSRLLGAILAGGLSRRFGSDKAVALWRGRPLIDHAVEALRPRVDEVAVCGRAGGRIGDVYLADRPGPHMGPLGGLCAALYHAREQGYDAVISVGCDTPALPDRLVETLAAAEGAAYLEALPIIGRWPVSLSTGLDHFLAEDRKHAVRLWADSVGARPMAWHELPNVNCPADLQALGASEA
jgi:molybdopterin-guanine dinucleotide biosynthesis protein A